MSILSDAFINNYRNKVVPWGYGALSYIVYKRTYARVLDNGQTEEWYQTVARCINGAQNIGANYTQEEAEKLYDHMFNLRAIYSGRMLWRLGTNDALSKYGDSLNNCWSVSMNSIESFCFMFEELMMGGGVGYSIRRQDINDLPKVKSNITIRHENTKDADFIVPDSRKGWVDLLRLILQSYFYTGVSFSYSTILIRGKGEPIKGFGGVASGPIVLVDGMEKICKVLETRSEKKLRSTDVLDICNIIGSIVVAGNVRRSAQIALGDSDDYLFAHAKDWSSGSIPNWRAYSNNTIYADSYSYLNIDFWNTYKGESEPLGLFNLSLAQTKGRLKDKDILDRCEMLNPCGEQTLESFECCNLAELPLNNIRSLEELKEIAVLLYKTQKAVASMPYLYKQTENVVHRNMRLGLSATGIMQSLEKSEWLDQTYVYLHRFDEMWSKQNGYKPSIKLTCIKPSGTVSLLTGSTPGIHPAFSNYYIRRVRMSSNDMLVNYCSTLGYKIEYARRFDGSINYETAIVEFPCHSNGKSDVTAIEQLELVKQIQTIWADNAVSCTVYYSIDELAVIQKWLQENYDNGIKSISFLLRDDHGFDQPPYEKIDQDTYFDRTVNLKPLISITELGELDIDECFTGACPIK